MCGITNPAEKYFKDGIWTFDGTVWRPQNQLRAYRSTWRETQQDLNAALGTNYLVYATVPSGEVWTVESCCCYNTTTSTCAILMIVHSGVADYVTRSTVYMPVTRYLEYAGQITLGPGDHIQFTIVGCVAGDDLISSVVGYKFLIAE